MSIIQIGNKIDIERCFTNTSQSKSYQLSQHMGFCCNFININAFPNGNTLERIKEINGKPQLLLEKISNVRKVCPAASQKDSLRRFTPVLTTEVVCCPCNFGR